MSGAIAAGIAAVAAAGMSAYGAIKQGEATAAADSYNAEVAANNAKISQQNAERAAAAGNAQAEQAALASRAKIGGILANQAAAGIDVGSGSAADVRRSEQKLGTLNVLTIRSNAARQAYGYLTQSASETGQAAMDNSAASNASAAGDISGAAAGIGGLGSAASNYSNYLSKAPGGSNLTSAPLSEGPIYNPNYVAQ